MNTNQIKKFAQQARTILKQGVINRLTSLGFDSNGNVAEEDKPQKGDGFVIFMDGLIYDKTFYDKWISLYERVKQKGIKEVYEEAAYTWFNRLMAIRIMAKNGFTGPVLEYQSEAVLIPQIVANARRGVYPEMSEADREQLMQLLDDDTQTTEQFRLLITNYCKHNPIIAASFGGVVNYTELLLPVNILSEGGFVNLLNNSKFITDEDYKQSELIGWLYQFYISEKKDEVFASFKKRKKAEAEDIPAATQIFTPNWIVKYMVENTLGRIYLDNNPYATELKDKMKYLVEPSKPTPEEAIFRYDSIHQLTIADLSCGSGHILNEAFDLLYDMYIEEGYSRRNTIEDIFQYNLLGIDLDTRAKQLSIFALLMKACQKDSSFLDAHSLPRVFDMSVAARVKKMNAREDVAKLLSDFFMGANKQVIDETIEALKLMEQADNLGSIMKFELSELTRSTIAMRTAEWKASDSSDRNIQTLILAFNIVLALTDKYASLAMNPPYMKSGNMNVDLSRYVKKNYPDTKADLFAVFMDVSIEHLLLSGKYGMINMQSWMYLPSFVKLRHNLLQNFSVDSLLHLGARTFDELSGEVVKSSAFILTNYKSDSANGSYYRLVDGVDCADKERLFSNDTTIIYKAIYQAMFYKIPDSRLGGYWASDKLIEVFKNPYLSTYSSPRKGNSTSNNARFLRLWYEIDFNKMGLNYSSVNAFLNDNKRWLPYNKGGGIRKWYGYNENLIDWKDNAEEIRKIKTSVITNEKYYMKPGLTWSTIASGAFGVRYFQEGFIFDNGGCCIFDLENQRDYIAGLLNSLVLKRIMSIFTESLNYQSGEVSQMPIILDDNNLISSLSLSCLSISRKDWDSHETSWDFENNELLVMRNMMISTDSDYSKGEEQEDGSIVYSEEYIGSKNLLNDCYEAYKTRWYSMYRKLHANEEELNRQFIEIYGLEDELTPDVPLEDITILQQGEVKIVNDELVFQADEVIKQFISYAVGCMMGRYRLDKPGLHIAHPNPTSEEVCSYEYNDGSFTIDDDGIIPLMPRDSSFVDNASDRLIDFLRVALGSEMLTENINFIEASLDKDIETYFIRDFWKDHLARYQRTPIYWLFESKKGAFQCITYMHRMNPYTVETIRTKYLLPHIESLNNLIIEMESRAASLTTQERRQLQNLQKDVEECMEYHERLHAVADEQIDFDLDDGVVVNHAKFGDVVRKLR